MTAQKLDVSACEHPRANRSLVDRRSGLRLSALVALAVVLWGGYDAHWSWTGINGHSATLWEWLNLLMLPVVITVLPIILRRRARLQPRHKAEIAAALVAFSALVLVGYAVPWKWTGFPGNRLWDWLRLLLLPLVVATLPLMAGLRGSADRRRAVLVRVSPVAAAFAVAVLGGYLLDWKWTGFHNNTLWDWMHLLFLPLIVPAVLLPSAQAMAAHQLADEAEAAAEARAGQSRGPSVSPPGREQVDPARPGPPATDGRAPGAREREPAA